MNLVLDIPVDFVLQLFGEWITVLHICKLEEALCSADNRLRLGCIYESLVMECGYLYYMDNTATMESQLDWLALRRIRVKQFRAFQPLLRSALPKFIALLKHSKTHLRELCVQGNDASLDTIVSCILRYCTELQTVTVEEMKLSAAFFAMISNLQNLKELTLVGCEDLYIEHLDGISCTSVRNLSLVGLYPTQPQQQLLDMCPNLLHFKTSGDNVVLHDLPITLESLSIEDCDTVRVINLNANLKKINIVCFDTSDEGVANIFTCCPHLEELGLTSSSNLTEATLFRIADTYGHSLKVLDVTGWDNLKCSSVKLVCEQCSHLTSLTFGGFCKNFNPNCIIVALDNCPSMRSLHIGRCAINDKVLARIATAPLDTLRVNDVSGITEKGIMTLVNGCATLQIITIIDKLFNPLVQLMWRKMRPDLKFLY